MIEKKLCELCNPKQWKTISSNMLTDDGYPVYGANGVIGYYNEYNHENRTILITCRGATCGTINICEPFSYVNGNAMALDDLSPDIELKYLFYYLTYRGMKDVITGSAQPQIVRQSLNNVKITYPLLEEQRKIAETLDKVSDLITKRKRQLEKLDLLIKSRFIEMFGDPVINPNQWVTMSFDEAFEIVSSKRILKSEWKTSGIPFLRVRDMVQLATTGTMKNEFFVSEEFYSKLKDEDGIPQKDDILISATSTLGKCYIVSEGERFYFKDADVLRFRAKKKIIPDYFVALMDTDYIKHQIKSTLGITTVSHFTINSAKKINLRYPDLYLQNKFAVFVQQTEKTKTIINQSLEKLETLKKALMQEYFG